MNKIYNISRVLLENQINESYEKLKFTPRGNQVEICADILHSYLNQGMRNVVLNCPTGGGKSIISAIVADVLDVLTDEDLKLLPSAICMGTNSLSQQYSESFSSLGKYEFFMIKGASNYPCKFMQNQPASPSKTAESCAKKRMIPQEIEKYCGGCEYDSAKGMINISKNLITNYTYFLISELASNHLKKRKLLVCDEAHTLNDYYCSYAEICVSVDLIDKYIKELSDTNGKCDEPIASLIMLKQLVSAGQVHEGNYKECLTVLNNVYSTIESILTHQSSMLKSVDIVKSIFYEKLSKKYKSNSQKIADLFNQEYDHIFDDSTPNTFTVKPIFIGKTMNTLLTHYNLFMSATITEDYAYDILELDRGETSFILIDPVFPPENKPLFFIGKSALNYNTLKDPDVIDEMKNTINKIVKYHENQKGLILAPSFYLGSRMVYGLRGVSVFEHQSGTNLPELMSEFRKYRGASILVSPSIFEGVNLPEASYCIILKSPFPSLGDRRIKHISDKYPNIYREMALLKLLQGIGRAVRSPTDTANTYFLDPSSKSLYNSKQNIWKNHYKVKI